MIVARQRCLNHPDREAAARCPECQRAFCRECVSEHDDRMICSACLQRLQAAPTAPRRRLAGLAGLPLVLAAVGLTWFFFFLVGRTLLVIPDSFHEGTIWKQILDDLP